MNALTLARGLGWFSIAMVTVTCGRLTEGFTSPGLVLLTEADVTGNRAAATTDSRTLGSKRRRNAVDLVTLQPGEAMFVNAGVVHAYLEGFGVEIMASSSQTPDAQEGIASFLEKRPPVWT